MMAPRGSKERSITLRALEQSTGDANGSLERPLDVETQRHEELAYRPEPHLGADLLVIFVRDVEAAAHRRFTTADRCGFLGSVAQMQPKQIFAVVHGVDP